MASHASLPLSIAPGRFNDIHEVRQAVEQALAGRVSTGFAQYRAAEFERVSTGIAALDELTGGWPRGALSEICGPDSSGRMTALISALAHATSHDEACCLVDVTDSFHPRSAAEAGVDLRKLLWVRCGESRRSSVVGRRQLRNLSNGYFALEQALKVTDLVLRGGGFGFVVIDMGDVAPRIARRVPLTSWFRFRRAVEKTRTVLLVVEQEANASTCAALVVSLRRNCVLRNTEAITHAQLLHGIEINAEVTRAPGKKQPQHAGTNFVAESEWKIG